MSRWWVGGGGAREEESSPPHWEGSDRAAEMSPQLYVTVYEEQFASPGPVRREQLRPTSAHRRNNPQPRPVSERQPPLHPQHQRKTCSHPLNSSTSSQLYNTAR